MQKRSAPAVRFMPSESPTAPVYRCYFLDARGGVVAVEVLDQPDDAGAIRAARARLAARNAGGRRHAGFELWDRDRRVHAASADEDRQAIA